LYTKIAGESTAAITEPCRIERYSIIELCVENRAGHLRIVGPGPTIEIVRSNKRPDVVDHTHLGMDVDGRAILILEVVDAYPVAARSL
jgi:hypothetical protein